MEYFFVKVFPFLKDILPWVVILGAIIKWLYGRRDTEENLTLTKIEVFSKAEERLRQTLEEQLESVSKKLDEVSKELEKTKQLLLDYEVELRLLRAERGLGNTQTPPPPSY